MTKSEKRALAKIEDRLHVAHDKAGEERNKYLSIQYFIDYLFNQQRENGLDLAEIKTVTGLKYMLYPTFKFVALAEHKALFDLAKIMKLENM